VPLETFTGTHVPSLLQQARAALGPDATIVGVHREGGRFTVVATNDPVVAPTVAPPAVPAAPGDFRRLLADQVSDVPARPAPAARGSRGSRGARPRLIALVGPTGAGKTTTIAKLATSALAFGHQRVGLLGLDGYRVGAVEQLATYAELAGLPLATATSEAELAPALARLADCEVVLIDTPGHAAALAAPPRPGRSACRHSGGIDAAAGASPGGAVRRVRRNASARHQAR
jgi:hypothetical protein